MATYGTTGAVRDFREVRRRGCDPVDSGCYETTMLKHNTRNQEGTDTLLARVRGLFTDNQATDAEVRRAIEEVER